ncbi:MAG: RNA polymerase sigma factor [Paracoccaceae bacterium]
MPTVPTRRRTPDPAASAAEQARTERLSRLLVQIAAKDKAAFRELYTLTAAKHLGIALHILHDRNIAEEVMQDIAMTIWRNAGRYDPAQGRPAAWMNAIARNQSIDRLRRERSRPETASEQIEEAGAETTDRILDRLAIGRLLSAIRPDYRQALILSYLKGLTHTELARELDVPIGTAKSWLRRGLQALAELTEPSAEDR